ncbi:hydrolase [Paenibacillus odorifer]|uniref:C40 family peptidase n=1 Tax=Paenibacillus TaxID=44249 RepID=UPI00096D8EB9|nr:SH3 domain-containing C40 family peptidase [Paenibacillus odorifer]OMD87174.1 hydrolase [Paenibacillus odorifer]
MIKSHKQITASLLVSAAIVAGLGVSAPGQAAAASSSSNSVTVASAVQTGVIEASVRLRSTPSNDGEIMKYLQKGDQVQILSQPNSYWYQVKTADGSVGYTSAGDKYISVSSASITTPSAQTGTIKYGVNLRVSPSTSGKIMKLLNKGEKVEVLAQPNSYWYQVKAADGSIGYISSSEQYSTLSGNGGGSGTVTPTPTPNPPITTPGASAQIERVIAAGMGYLGTPYEYGSSRNDTSTFDCSDFIRQIFMDATNLKLPADSRQQGDWVKANSTVVTSISNLKRGDLMFFMDYKGNSASAYEGIDKSTARISHVAMYLGDGQVLQTYSVASGGVRVDKLSASWMNRFLYGGSVIR